MVELDKRDVYQFGEPDGTRLVYEPIKSGGSERRVELCFLDSDGQYSEQDLNLSLTETEHLGRCLLELVRIERLRAGQDLSEEA